VNFFSDERANELRDLFFESATELLQALNEAGLQLEQHPSDSEIIRTIRRTVHTLKGDSAACGFRELSELAHEIEDVLTPEMAAKFGPATAQLVLTAADMFDSMLSAYRANAPAPVGNEVRELVERLKNGGNAEQQDSFEPAFGWSEYERLVISQASGGRALFNVGIQIDPACPMRFAGMQLVQNVLNQIGTVLVMHPESATVDVGQIEAVLASDRTREAIEQKCKVPAVTSAVVVRPYCEANAEPQAIPAIPVAEEQSATDDVLGLGRAEATVSPAPVTPVVEESVAQEREKQQSTPVATENILRVDAERIDTVLYLVG